MKHEKKRKKRICKINDKKSKNLTRSPQGKEGRKKKAQECYFICHTFKKNKNRKEKKMKLKSSGIVKGVWGKCYSCRSSWRQLGDLKISGTSESSLQMTL